MLMTHMSLQVRSQAQRQNHGLFQIHAPYLQQRRILFAVPSTFSDVDHQATTCAALQHLLGSPTVPHIGSHRLDHKSCAVAVYQNIINGMQATSGAAKVSCCHTTGKIMKHRIRFDTSGSPCQSRVKQRRTFQFLP